MSISITSFFSKNGKPVTGLSPTIRIWQITPTTQELIVGAPTGSGSDTDGVMTEVVDVGSPSQSDGFYTYEFTAANGYDPTIEYVYRVDGGATLPRSARYQVGESKPSVWDETANEHLIGGSTGEKLTQIHSASQALILALSDVEDLINILLKYETNRTRIDPVAKTLTVYDDDCTTILRVFDLKNAGGTASVDDVCERTPVSATDGLPVCP